MSQDLEAEKRAVAAHAVGFVRERTIVGLGSGTTSRYFVELLARRVADERLPIACVASSRATAELGRKLGLEVRSLDEVERVDLYVDGADEISTGGAIVKGGGGALLGEKIVAANSEERVYIADSSKLVRLIGKAAVPVEVVPFGHTFTARTIRGRGAQAVLRMAGGAAFRTDSGHFIYDCRFGPIEDPAELNRALRGITGVVETGLFLGLGGTVVTVIGGNVVERRGAPFSWGDQ